MYSAVLTAFIIDRNQNIQQTPAQQSAFFQNQSVVLLSQISNQVSSLGSQASAPSNLSLPDFTLSPTASDVRVNIIWIISLVFSLSAALLATLVQQWARDYMHIYQRYSHPLRVARIRQYLHEGVKNWHMREIAEAVPGLVHISLLLFLAGLTDFLRNAYRSVGTAAVVLISLYVLLYTIATVAPVVNPQSLYRTPFSRLIWYLTQKLWKRSCNNHFGEDSKPLSPNMVDGQMQLAMERNDARKRRDERSIRWLVNNLTYDVEVEPLASGIPGSLNAKWGEEVWKNDDPKLEKDELYKRIGRLSETCNDRGSFANEDEWRKRSRACVETVASFVFCIGADISLFRNLGKLLSDLGSAERTCEVSEITTNRSFAIRWTCLSLAATRKMLNSPQLQSRVECTLSKLARIHLDGSITPYEGALRSARKIDCLFAEAWDWVDRLRLELNVVGDSDRTGGRIEEVLHRYEPKLKSIRDQLVPMARLGVDASISELQRQIDEVTHNLTRQLPGVASDRLTGFTPVEQVFDLFANPVRPQLICLSQLLHGLCAVSRKRSSRGYQDTIKALQAAERIPSSLRSVVNQHHLMERQLWRLEDLRVGGAFGFTVELYFLSLRHILSTFTSPPREIHKTLYVNTFKAITSDWPEFTNSIGTLQVILNLVYDIAFQDRGIFSNFEYPEYITKELLDLLGRMIEGQAGAYIDDAMEELWRDDLTVLDPRFQSSAAMAIQGQLPE